MGSKPTQAISRGKWTNYGKLQGSKLLGFLMSETPKNGEGNPNFLVGFPTGNPGFDMQMDNLKLGSSGRKPRNSRGQQNPEAGFPNGNPHLNRNFQPCKLVRKNAKNGSFCSQVFPNMSQFHARISISVNIPLDIINSGQWAMNGFNYRPLILMDYGD